MRTRQECGCPPPPNGSTAIAWEPKEIVLLGTMPDADLARRLGRSLNAVCLKRRRMKIPNHQDRQSRPPC
jgi:hypothetical protein